MSNISFQIPLTNQKHGLSVDVHDNRIVYSSLTNYKAQLYAGHYGIKLPLYGLETYVLNGNKYVVGDNHFLLTNPGQRTEVLIDSDKPVRGICIGLRVSFLRLLHTEMSVDHKEMLNQQKQGETDELNVLNHCYSIKNTQSHLARFLHAIKQEYTTHGCLNYEEGSFYYSLGEAIIHAQNDVHIAVDQLSQQKLAIREEVYRRVDFMNQYIHDNFLRQITLDELAQVAMLSKYHAIRSFQKVFGISPYQQIKKLRIQKAKILLGHGETVSATAHTCGFTDYRGFSKQFKQVVGLSPSQYQRALKD